MSIEDKLAIHEIIAQYAYTYDGQDAEGFAQLFVEDGVFEIFVPGQSGPSVRLRSRTEIRDWAAHRLQERRGRFTSRHYQSGTLFDELTSEAALTRTMVLVTHAPGGACRPRSRLFHVAAESTNRLAERLRLAAVETARLTPDARRQPGWSGCEGLAKYRVGASGLRQSGATPFAAPPPDHVISLTPCNDPGYSPAWAGSDDSCPRRPAAGAATTRLASGSPDAVCPAGPQARTAPALANCLRGLPDPTGHPGL